MTSTARMLRGAARLMARRMRIEAVYDEGGSVPTRTEAAVNRDMRRWLEAHTLLLAPAKPARKAVPR